MIWYSLSVSVSAGATVMESPVCTPIGSTFSIEQMMMQLSALSRTTSISNSFQPSTLSSIRTSVRRRGVEAARDDLRELLAVVGDAAAGAAQREGRADDRRQADVLERALRPRPRVRDACERGVSSPIRVHRLAEQLAVLGLVDRLGVRADHLDAVFLQHAALVQRQRGVQRGLAAHRRQQRVGALGVRDDLGDDVGRDRLDIGGVGQLRVGHDRRRVGVDQNDPVALRFRALQACVPE